MGDTRVHVWLSSNLQIHIHSFRYMVLRDHHHHTAAVSSNGLDVVIVEACHRARSFRTIHTYGVAHACMHARIGACMGAAPRVDGTHRHTGLCACAVTSIAARHADMATADKLQS